MDCSVGADAGCAGNLYRRVGIFGAGPDVGAGGGKTKEKRKEWVGKQELLEEFYSGPCRGILNLEFLTPTAFKSNGRYQIFPDMRYIYQSFMNKYSAASAEIYNT